MSTNDRDTLRRLRNLVASGLSSLGMCQRLDDLEMRFGAERFLAEFDHVGERFQPRFECRVEARRRLRRAALSAFDRVGVR